MAAWILFFSLPDLLKSYDKSKDGDNHFSDPGFKWLRLITSIVWVGIFYLNAFVLTPYFINRRKYLSYAGIQLLCFVLVACMHWLIFKTLITTQLFRLGGFVGFNIFPFLLMVTGGTMYQMLRDKARADKLKEEKEKENLTAELSFLRSQISPHFMFNVLNNMVALVRLKSDELEPTIFRLSSLMRYMLYEADAETVLLQKEVEYLQNYIDLQRQRIGNKVKLNVSMMEPGAFCHIAPMLLIPFIENAFKHGVGQIDKPQIDIALAVQQDELHFSVRNKFNPASKEVKDKTSGIGLANVQRRLNLLYGNRHELRIAREDNWFTVSLQLNLNHAAMYSR